MLDRVVSDKFQLRALLKTQLVGDMTSYHTRSAFKSLYSRLGSLKACKVGNVYLAVGAVARKLCSNNGNKARIS